jgi:hypothetical protein
MNRNMLILLIIHRESVLHLGILHLQSDKTKIINNNLRCTCSIKGARGATSPEVVTQAEDRTPQTSERRRMMVVPAVLDPAAPSPESSSAQ